MTIEYKEFFTESVDSVRLYFRRWFVPKPKGLIGIVHGFAEHSGRYVDLAETLIENNWSVAMFDYRGHGQSGGRRAHVDHFVEYLNDLRSFVAEIGKEGFLGRPILLGHSQGGLIVTRYAQLEHKQLAGLILSSPFLGFAVRPNRFKAILGKLMSEVVPAFRMKSRIDPNLLTHDSRIVKQYVFDPLIGNTTTARWFTEVAQAQRQVFKEHHRLVLPLLVLQAGDDRLVSGPAVRRLLDMVPSTDKTLYRYDGHFHEVLHEIGRDKVMADLLVWLERLAE